MKSVLALLILPLAGVALPFVICILVGRLALRLADNVEEYFTDEPQYER